MPSLTRDWGTLVVCSWCKKLRLSLALTERPEFEEWTEVKEAVKKLKLFDLPSLPILSHGVCNACKNKILAGFEEEIEKSVIVLSRFELPPINP